MTVAPDPVTRQVRVLTTLRFAVSFKSHFLADLGSRDRMRGRVKRFLLDGISYVSTVGDVGDVGHHHDLVLSLIERI